MLDLSGRVSGRVDGHCRMISLTTVLRKAAYPLPMGDCDESLINLQYFAGAVENGQPKSFTMQLSPRVVKDIKKQPTARGPTVRMRRDKQGSMPELPGTDSPCVVDTSRHQVSLHSRQYPSDLR